MGLFDDIVASKGGAGSVTTSPPKGGLFNDVLGETTPKNEPKLSPELQIDKENVGIASQAGNSLARTIVGLPGALGSVGNAWGALGDAARNKGWLPKIPENSLFAHKLTDSEDVAKWVEKTVPASKDYISREPTNAAERAASVVGSFAAGPSGGVRSVITNQVVPAIATAAASEAAHNGTLPQWAVPAASIASTVAAHGAGKVLAHKAPPMPPLPTHSRASPMTN